MTSSTQRRSFASGLLLAGIASVALLSGCGTPKIQDYAQESPVLELRDYLTAHSTLTASSPTGLAKSSNGSPW